MPHIGLLSDSHSRAAATRSAVDILLRQGATVLLHLGDVGTPEVIDALVAPGIESRLVFGNTDWDTPALERYATGLGVHVDHPVGQLTYSDKQLVYTHGHLPAAMTNALAQHVNYLCHGHTHEPRDERHGPTRIINPGALFRANQYSVALLDTDTDTLNFFPVNKI